MGRRVMRITPELLVDMLDLPGGTVIADVALSRELGVPVVELVIENATLQDSDEPVKPKYIGERWFKFESWGE